MSSTEELESQLEDKLNLTNGQATTELGEKSSPTDDSTPDKSNHTEGEVTDFKLESLRAFFESW